MKGESKMDKKPLIGVSILAVVLLVLGSLSNVVGYQSVKSTAMNDSPLFQTRTQRATNQQQNSITCQYLGKGREITIHLLGRAGRTESFNAIVNWIKRMDDGSLQRLAYLIKYNLPQNDEIKEFNQEVDNEEIFLALKELRDNPDINIDNIKKSKDSKIQSDTCTIFCTTYFELGCLSFWILLFIIVFFSVFVYFPIQIIRELLTIESSHCL
jgi:hypothetical protein